MPIWNPFEHTDQENLRWAWLRAIEWGVWPRFVAQPIVPVLLIFFPWQWVVGSVIVLTWVWVLIRYKFVSADLATLGATFVRLKWLTCPASCIYLWIMGQKQTAVLALLWPLVTLLLTIVGPSVMVGTLQNEFMRQVGYFSGDSQDMANKAHV